jgi:hypothetical protein
MLSPNSPDFPVGNQPTIESVLYREIFAYLSASPSEGRAALASAMDIPRPLARSMVHFFGLIRSDTITLTSDDLADQIARSLSDWFVRLWHQLRGNIETVQEKDAEISDATLESPSILVALLRRWWPEGDTIWTRGLRTMENSDDAGVRRAVARQLLAERDRLRRQRRDLQLERALRLVTAPLADHLNEIVPAISDLEVRVLSVFRRPGAWNIFEMYWNDIDWTLLETTARGLEQEDDLAALAQRVVRGVDPLPERIIWQRDIQVSYRMEEREEGYGEITDIHRTTSPVMALPSELGLLAFPETEDLFLHKLAEDGVLALRSRRVETIRLREERETWRRVVSPQRLGPLVVCLDTSGSMQDIAGTIAGVATLGFVRESLRQGRPITVIATQGGLHVASFLAEAECVQPAGTQSNTANLTAPGVIRIAPEPVAELQHILSPPGYSGADVTPALEAGLHYLENHPDSGTATADLVIISDIHFPKIGPDHRNRIALLQSRGWIRFHGLTIGLQGIDDPLNVFDYRWHYNIAEEVDFRSHHRPRRIGISGRPL